MNKLPKVMGEQDDILLLKQNIARSYNWYAEPDWVNISI